MNSKTSEPIQEKKKQVQTHQPQQTQQIPEEEDQSHLEPIKQPIKEPENINDIVYENDQMQLIIEKGTHLRQIKFRLEDHMFHMKIKLKDTSKKHPLLRDILQFLEIAFNIQKMITILNI